MDSNISDPCRARWPIRCELHDLYDPILDRVYIGIGVGAVLLVLGSWAVWKYSHRVIQNPDYVTVPSSNPDFDCTVAEKPNLSKRHKNGFGRRRRSGMQMPLPTNEYQLSVGSLYFAFLTLDFRLYTNVKWASLRNLGNPTFSWNPTPRTVKIM